jgi:hypothetical protein
VRGANALARLTAPDEQSAMEAALKKLELDVAVAKRLLVRR